MDLLKYLKAIVVLTPLIGGCISLPKERDRNFYEDRINKISSIEVLLNTVTKVANKEPTTYEKKGYGFVVGEYIFSKNHVTSRYTILVWQTTPYGPKQVNIPLNRDSVLNEETFLDDLVLHSVYESKEDDVAIFDLSLQPSLCKKYCNDLTLDDLMKEDELYQGMRVYLNASPGLVNGFYKESHIVKLRSEKNKDTPFENTFYMQENVIRGTSGKPVWHKDKIVGIVDSYWNYLGGVGFMDNYIQEIEKYEK